MKIKLSELNNASVIILDSYDFLKVKIDKTNGIVTELIHTGEETNRDVTQEVLKAESNYTIGDMVIDSPYTLGMVIAKLLKNEVNQKCMCMLNAFDEVRLK